MNNGYGGFTISKGKETTTHRLSWILNNGTVPTGLFVCHHCDVRTCVRPDHLFLGTAQDNTDDMLAKHGHWRSRR